MGSKYILSISLILRGFLKGRHVGPNSMQRFSNFVVVLTRVSRDIYLLYIP